MSWDTSWDIMSLGSNQAPGAWKFSFPKGLDKRQIENVKSKGYDGLVIKDRGLSDADVVAETQITADQFGQWVDWKASSLTSSPGKKRTPVQIRNPIVNHVGITTVYFWYWDMASPRFGEDIKIKLFFKKYFARVSRVKKIGFDDNVLARAVAIEQRRLENGAANPFLEGDFTPAPNAGDTVASLVAQSDAVLGPLSLFGFDDPAFDNPVTPGTTIEGF